jgi:hypothetical protein
MANLTQFSGADPEAFLSALLKATTVETIRAILGRLPIVDEVSYLFDEDNPAKGWREGHLHWYPVGGERGNAGRIKLAGEAENPIAERTVNGMESLIELQRQLELKKTPDAEPPRTPREAVKRYFELPPLHDLPRVKSQIRGMKAKDHARDMAKKIKVRLLRQEKPREYAVLIEDEGIGQAPERIHETLLSLGSSDKADKPYLIGVFGQGGSSAYAASEFSLIISRRHRDLLAGNSDGIGWTIVRRIRPTDRRDVYWAYLAASPDGQVPGLPATAAGKVGYQHGARIVHIKGIST